MDVQGGEPAVTVEADLTVQEVLGRVHRGLATDRLGHDAGGVTDVVVVGAVVVGVGTEEAPVVVQLEGSRRLEALGRHAASVGQDGRAADDSCAGGGADQTVIEHDVVNRCNALEPAGAVAPATLYGLRRLRLELASDGIEAGLGRGEGRQAGSCRREGPHVLRIAREQFAVVGKGPGEASLGKEGLLGSDRSIDHWRTDHRHRAALDADRLEAEVDLQLVGNGPGVLKVEGPGVGLEVARPLGEEGPGEEAQRRRGRGQILAVEATRLAEFVGLQPPPGRDPMGAELEPGTEDQAHPVDGVLGGPGRDRGVLAGRAGDVVVRRGHVGRVPNALAVIGVAIDGGGQVDTGYRTRSGEGPEGIIAQAGGVIVGVVDALHLARIGVGTGACVAAVPVKDGVRSGVVGAGLVGAGDLDGLGPAAGIVVPIGAQARDHVQGQVLVIVLAALGVVVEGGDREVADRLDELQVDLLLVLLALALPLVSLLVGIADGAPPATGQFAGVSAQEDAEHGA